MTKTNARDIADLVSGAVAQGAKTVEEIHRIIADLPLSILDSVDALKQPVKEARRLQDRSLGAIYETIRRVNDEVGKLAHEALGAVQPKTKKAAKKAAKQAAPKAAKKSKKAAK